MRTHSVPTLVGRQLELSALDSWLEHAQGGHGGLGLIEGPAGSGKTALLRAFVERAAEQGVRTAWGRVETGARSRLPWPWPTILRRLREPECIELAAELGRSPLVAAAADVPEEGPRVREADMGDRVAKQLLLTLLPAVRERPTIIVIDDVHWMDMASVALLRILIEHAEELPLLVMAATRPEDDVTAAALTSPQRELAFAADRRKLTLGPLDGQAIGELLGGELTRKLGGPAAATRLVEGLPLVALELRTTAQWPAGEGGSTSKPGIAALAHQHWRALDDEGRELVDACAVYRKSLNVGLLGAVLDIDPVEIEKRIHERRDAGFLAADREAGLGVYRFSHDLLAEAVEAELDPARRRDLHARFAAELTRRNERDGGTEVGEIAYHACQGVPIVPGGEAAEYARRAAAEANESGSHAVAAAWVRDGLSSFELDTKSETALLRAGLLVEDFFARLGEDTEASIQLVGEIRQVLARATPMVRFGVVSGIFAGSDWTGAHPGVLRELGTLIEGSLRDHPSADHERTVLLTAKAFVFNLLPGVDACATAGDAAREAFASANREDAMPGERSYAILARLVADTEDLDLEERCRLATELEARAEDELPDSARNISEAIQVAETLMCGRLAEAMACIERATQRIENNPAATARWYPSHLRAVRASMIADVETATSALAESLARTTASDYVPAYLAALILSSHLHEVTGTLLQIEGFVEPSQAARRRVSSRTMPALDGSIEANADAWHAGILKWGARTGDDFGIHSTLDQMATTGFREFPRNANWLSAICLLAETAAILEHRTAAPILLQLLEPHAEIFNVVSAGVCPGGMVAGYMAPLAALSGDLDAAVRLADEATRANDRMGLVVFATMTRLEQARFLQARGRAADVEKATTLAREAKAGIERYGLGGLEPKLAALAAPAVSPEPGGDTHATAADPPVLPRAGFWQDGAGWVACWQNESVRLKGQRGFVVLRELVRNPGTPLHVRELMILGSAAVPASVAAEQALQAGEMHVAADDGIEVLDDEALRAYRARLEEIEVELAEAEGHADLGRGENLRHEREVLLDSLRSATAVGGRRRKVSSDVERSRTAIRKRIKSALDRLREAIPALAEHLDASLTTGIHCSYDPETRLAWLTDPAPTVDLAPRGSG